MIVKRLGASLFILYGYATLTACAPPRPSILEHICATDEEACAHWAQRLEQLQWIETADPVRDAREAITLGSPPIVALYGYATYTPGADHVVEGGDCRFRLLEGTGDYHIPETLRLQEIAERYAQTYNALVLPHSGCVSPEDRASS